MGKLDKAVGYLSGAMEYVPDRGVAWRKKFIQMSHDANLQIDYIDPTNKPGKTQDEDQNIQQSLQSSGQFQKLKEFVNDYRHLDLRYVDYSDFLVVMIDPTIPQWGTSDEVYFAERQHKPTFFICQGGLYKLPRWLFDVVELDLVFEDVESAVDRLVLLNDGELPLSKEWVLIRGFIEDSRVTYQAPWLGLG